MASKNLFARRRTLRRARNRNACRRLGDSRHGRLLTSSPKLRTKSVERHCVQAFFVRTGRNLNLGMPSS